jgi:hypothetical protein
MEQPNQVGSAQSQPVLEPRAGAISGSPGTRDGDRSPLPHRPEGISHRRGELSDVRISLPSILWLVVGALVASAHHYLENLDALRPVVSAVLAVVLWPLLLLGINLHVH